jgi:hypothetical protein
MDKYLTNTSGCITIRKEENKELVGIILKTDRLTQIFACTPMSDEEIAKLISGRSLISNLNPQIKNNDPDE